MYPEKVLIMRFSAMGDVLLLVPVVKSLIEAYPRIEITILTRPKFASFFSNIPGVNVFEADVDHTYSGLLGMRKLFRDLLRKGGYDVVIDMHDHIRTIMLRTFFQMTGTKVIVFKKGRKEKKAFTRKEDKVTRPLPHTVERYKEAFTRAGFLFEVKPPPHLSPTGESVAFISSWLEKKGLSKQEYWIGVAPFAMHTTKIWPIKNYASLVEGLNEKIKAKFFLFGGGEKEVNFFHELKQQFPEQCVIVAGQMKMKDEIALMQHIDLMVCVDSSNMHLAALCDVALVSVWGGTYPAVGFGPYGKDDKDIVQISREELYCRPCSVYGRETCFRGDFACMNRISVEQVESKIISKLHSRDSKG